MGMVTEPVVKCSNYVGEALDQAAVLDFAEILLVGHMGKLCKLSAGIMNTHSRMADGRAEIFTAQAALAGADAPLCRRLMQAATSDACIELLGPRRRAARAKKEKPVWWFSAACMAFWAKPKPQRSF